MTNGSEIPDNLYSLYEDLAASGAATIGTAGGFNYVGRQGSAWPQMAYPGRSLVQELERPDIAALTDSIRSGACPRLLLIEEKLLTEEVRAQLSSFRFVPAAQWVNMTADLPLAEGAEKTDRLQPDCRIVETQHSGEWVDWVSVVEEVLFKKAKLAVELFVRNGNGLFDLLAAYYQNQIVSTALLYKGKCAGIYMVATLPSFQGKGLAGQLMRFAGSVAAGYGYTSLVLHSTRGGLELYKSLGFQERGKLSLYYYMA